MTSEAVTDKVEGTVTEKPEVKGSGVVKTSINLTPEMIETLKTLAAATGSSMADVIRRAITLEKFLLDKKEEGGKLLIEEKDKSLKEIVLR